MPKKIDLSNLDHLDFPKDDDGNYLGKYVAYKTMNMEKFLTT